jgi:hypothetical protein
MKEIQIGKIYNVAHSRKGKFTMRITSISGEWITGIIIDSTAKAMLGYNYKYSGDEITVRECFCTFDLMDMSDKEVRCEG